MIKLTHISSALFYATILLGLILMIKFMATDEGSIGYEVSNTSSHVTDLPVLSDEQKTDSDNEKESFRAFINNQDAEEDIEDIEDIDIDESMLR